MPKSRKNPKRKLTRCGCHQGWIERGGIPWRRCTKCDGSGMVPESKK
jgi:hypothetical protein